MAIKPKIIAETLKTIGLLTEEDIDDALRVQRETKERLSSIMVQKGYIASESLGSVVAPQLGLVPEDIASRQISQEVLNMVNIPVVATHRIIPVKFEKDVLTLATDNPFNFLAIDNLRVILKNRIELIYVTESEMNTHLEKFYAIKDGTAMVSLMETMEKPTSAEPVKKVLGMPAIPKEEEAPVVKLVSLIISEAFKKRASDIHIEPLESKFRIRYRIDGVLHEVPGPPKRLQGSIISRIKIMAGMDIAEKRLPQDGRIKISLVDRELDLRVSTLPAIYGESVVMRILDKSSMLIGLKELGFLSDDQKKFERLIKVPNGIFLITGPTGSGKTTTLYAALNNINKPDRKLITIEDPVEYQLTGINQVQIKPQINLTFASGLRSILRQAPDIIMVGEIRDLETAQIAIQAALTGHLVFSTLHTNDSASAITRLIDMGIKPYLVASAVQAVLAQRLVRSICKKCKIPYTATKEELMALEMTENDIKGKKLFIGKGCDECSDTGYKGRIGIFELLILNDVIRPLIFEKVPSSVIKDKARKEGMYTLREDGIRKVFEGMTTFSEVIRVTKADLG